MSQQIESLLTPGFDLERASAFIARRLATVAIQEVDPT